MIINSYIKAFKGAGIATGLAMVGLQKLLNRKDVSTNALQSRVTDGLHAKSVLEKAGVYQGEDPDEAENKRLNNITLFLRDSLYSRLRNDDNGFYIEDEDVEFISQISETQYGIQISKRFEGKYFPSFNRVLYTIYKTDDDEPSKLRWKKDLTLVLFSQRDGSLVPKFFIP